LKKRSVANSISRKPPEEELIFFLDRQLGRHKMAGILRAAALNVEPSFIAKISRNGDVTVLAV
jgi:hypothetical protein